MRFIKPSEHDGAAGRPFFAWKAFKSDAALIFDVKTESLPFFCFFFKGDPAAASPRVAFDFGHGFDDLSAVAFREFPFGFYHVPLTSIGSVKRIRLRIAKAPTTLRCLVFMSGQPMLVAILHFLFNLRYQNIGIVAPATGGQRDWRSYLSSNVVRIRTFFATVSGGRALAVQQRDDDMVDRLRLWQTMQAKPIEALLRRSLLRFERPLISFVTPAFNTSADHVRDLVASFAAQDAPYAELVIVDDGSTDKETRDALKKATGVARVKLVEHESNGGIAVACNTGINTASGVWVGFIDHDDAFASGAIAMIARAILEVPNAQFLYTDEIIANGALETIGCFCKPAFDPVLLSGMNYINHFSVFRRARLRALGGFNVDCEGSQDYDLLLRYLVDIDESAVVHVPFLAYVWRRGENSYSAVHRERAVANARFALKRAYQMLEPIDVEPARSTDVHRVRFRESAQPLVSVIIPNRDSLALIERVVGDLRDKTDYPALEIIVPDNGTADPAVLAFYRAQDQLDFVYEIVDEPFNFSRMCNRGARLATGDALLFLNNDVEVVDDRDWLAEMVECLSFPQTGIVGARLLFPNNRIQHAGVMIGLGGAAGHWYDGDDPDEPGPMGRLAVRQRFGAVTGACMLVNRSCFDALDGFDETEFPIAYNDVDLCARAAKIGYRTVWTPFATLVHHESLSRGADTSGVNRERLLSDMERLQTRHHTRDHVDPAYSPFFDRAYARPRLAIPKTLPNWRTNSGFA